MTTVDLRAEPCSVSALRSPRHLPTAKFGHVFGIASRILSHLPCSSLARTDHQTVGPFARLEDEALADTLDRLGRHLRCAHCSLSAAQDPIVAVSLATLSLQACWIATQAPLRVSSASIVGPEPIPTLVISTFLPVRLSIRLCDRPSGVRFLQTLRAEIEG